MANKKSKNLFYPIPQNGHVLILNGINFHNNGLAELTSRESSKADIDGLKTFFNNLGNFKVKVKQDFTTEDITNGVFPEFIRTAETENTDFIFVAVMTHGAGHSFLYTSDNQIHFDRQMLLKLNSRLEPSLKDIPKIFLVNACRGKNSWGDDENEDVDDGPSDRKKNRYPVHENVLLIYSTLDGHVSKRSKDSTIGTRFIKTLCDFLDKHCRTTHLEDILTMVTGQFGSPTKPQVPEIRKLGFGKFLLLTATAKPNIETTIERMRKVNITSKSVKAQKEVNDSADVALSDEVQFKGLQDGRNILKSDTKKLFCRLLCKIQVQTSRNKDTCFKFLFIDKCNTEMEGFSFNQLGEVLFQKLKEGECVKIKEVNVERKEERYRDWWLTGGTLQLKFANTNAVEVVEDIEEIPKYGHMNITTLQEVEDMEHGEKTDILGVVTSFSKFKLSINKKKYREVSLKDRFGTQAVCTFWGKRATVEKDTVIYIRALNIYRPNDIMNMEDKSKDQVKEIKTDYYSVPQCAVVIEIKNSNQMPPEYREIYEHFCTCSKKKPDRKRKMPNND